MTTNETLWFRDVHPFQILEQVLFPDLAAELRAGTRRRIRIWSAASSTGQEPYSIAITATEACRRHSNLRREHFEIVATDISPTALAVATTARYDCGPMTRGLPDEHSRQYFHREGSSLVVDASINRSRLLWSD